MTALRCEATLPARGSLPTAPCLLPVAMISAGHLVLRARHHGENHEIAVPLAQLLEATVTEASLPVVAAALLARLAQGPVMVLESALT